MTTKSKAKSGTNKPEAKTPRIPAAFNVPPRTGTNPKGQKYADLAPREGTKRARVLAAIKDGGRTQAQIAKMFKNWKPRHVVECLTLCNRLYGCGFRTSADGVIHLRTK